MKDLAMTLKHFRTTTTLVLVLIVMATFARADGIPDRSAVYALSQEVKGSLHDVAASSDILILGEIHGTQEVPAVAAALLPSLSQLGYRTLALEIPANKREQILAWAKGTTTVLPAFFTAPPEDGRESIELLTLIRTAVSPPFQWQLICFDESLDGLGTGDLPQQVPTEAELIRLSVKRDAAMASKFCDQHQQQNTKQKVLAICGNLHARTANHAPPNEFLNKLWPSFAAALKTKKPNWHVNSVNVVPHRGGYFNAGRVNQINDQAIEQVIFKRLKEGDWNFQLDLPVATPATFLKAPRSKR